MCVYCCVLGAPFVGRWGCGQVGISTPTRVQEDEDAILAERAELAAADEEATIAAISRMPDTREREADAQHEPVQPASAVVLPA